MLKGNWRLAISRGFLLRLGSGGAIRVFRGDKVLLNFFLVEHCQVLILSRLILLSLYRCTAYLDVLLGPTAICRPLEVGTYTRHSR